MIACLPPIRKCYLPWLPAQSGRGSVLTGASHPPIRICYLSHPRGKVSKLRRARRLSGFAPCGFKEPKSVAFDTRTPLTPEIKFQAY